MELANLRPRPEEAPRPGAAEPIGFERFPLFDSARAIAVLLVVTIHATSQVRIGDTGVLSFFGHLDVGVTIFFLISGFLLYRPFAVAHAERAAQPSTGAYAWRRILRIVPAYWIALTVAAIVLNLPGVLSGHGIATYYGFAQIYGRETYGGGIAPAWSLNIEIAFYALLPLYAIAIQRLTGARRDWLRIELAGLALLVIVATAWKAGFLLSTDTGFGESRPIAYTFLPHYLDQFALGMGLAVLSVWTARRAALPRALELVERRPAIPWIAAAVAFVIVCRIGIPPVYLPQKPTNLQVFERHWLYAAVAVGVLLPVAFGNPRRGWVRRLLANRALLYLGTISYGVYLWHRPVINKAHELGVDFGDGRIAYLLWLLFALALTAAIAAVSWHLVEKPILSLKHLIPDRGRRRRDRDRPPVQPAGAEPKQPAQAIGEPPA